MRITTEEQIARLRDAILFEKERSKARIILEARVRELRLEQLRQIVRNRRRQNRGHAA